MHKFLILKSNSEMNKKSKRVQDSVVTMTEMVMPNDTNPLGNLMGGYLMRWMDIASSICAAKHCKNYVVTASVDNISFQSPIHVGDVITFTAKMSRAFNTSMEIFVEVFAETITGDNPRKSNQAYFTFVALDEKTLQPIPVPALIPLTDEEKKRYEGAERRRELRLILSGRIKATDALAVREFFKNMD